jgi:molybdenum cofactor cytidylyltransferase
MTKPIGAIVLAAGFSSRFGSSKLLAELKNGKSVYQQTVERIAEALPSHIIVTRPEMAERLQQLTRSTTVLSFNQAEQGMGATLAFAAQHIDDWSACLVCLGDMPFVKASTYRLISEHVSSDSIVTPMFDTKMGNPVAFGRSFFPELAALSGDSGGRKLIDKHQDAARTLQVEDPGILQDIDTEDELALYQEQ